MACKKIKSIEFEKDSKLEIIDVGSFGQIPLAKTTIPSSVKLINDSAFAYSKLNCIIFDKNSQLIVIKNRAFYKTSIFKIIFPSKLRTIGKEAFSECHNLKTATAATNSQYCFIQKDSFNNTSIQLSDISSNIITIEN